MLGLLLIYFIGKAFYDLSIEFNNKKWLFAILGVVSYYFGTFIGGIVLTLIGFAIGSDFVTTINKIVLNLLGIPFGLLTSWAFYKILKAQWSKNTQTIANDVLDADLI